MPPKENKKTPKIQLPAKEKIVKAAVSLAAQQEWEFVTVRDISDTAGVSLSEFYDQFETKDDIILAYGRQLDSAILRNFSDYNPETPARDLLFDILMERFDLATPDRVGLKSILTSFRKDPKNILHAMPHVSASMTRMLEVAGMDAYGIKGTLRVAGLSAVVLWTAKTWLKDESQDLSKTMAVLDKALSKAEVLADRFGF